MYTIGELKQKVPLVKSWISDLLIKYANQGDSVESFNFPNLVSFYDKKILSTAKVIIVKEVPKLPLSTLGIPELSIFEQGDYSGVTYLNTYFLSSTCSHQEPLHFHELVHVIQWARLGIDRFILLYGLLIIQFGYRNNPLEQMAYAYQNLFVEKKCPPDLVAKIIVETDNIAKQYSI